MEYRTWITEALRLHFEEHSFTPGCGRTSLGRAKINSLWSVRAVTDLLLPPHNATSRQHNMWCRIQLLMTLYVVSSP